MLLCEEAVQRYQIDSVTLESVLWNDYIAIRDMLEDVEDMDPDVWEFHIHQFFTIKLILISLNTGLF